MASAGSPKKKHRIPGELKDLHKEKRTHDGTGDGACLWAHAEATIYKEDDSCSYRWQAHEAAREWHRDLFDGVDIGRVPDRWKKRIRNWEYKGVPGTVQELHTIPLPKGIDWNLDGPDPKRQASLKLIHPDRKVRGKIRNFATNAQWPYPFNAHHLIPKGLFLKTIDKMARNVDKDRAGEIKESLQNHLMSISYSIHHKVNMMPLPVLKTVAAMIGVPRHLTKSPSGPEETSLAKECFSHQKYDNWVQEKLNKALKRMAKKVKACDLSDPAGDKRSLEKISQECRAEIVKLGGKKTGAPLAAITTAGTKPAPPTKKGF